MREVQLLGIDTENNKDTTRVTLTDLDEGEYILSFQSPKTLEYTQSAPIPAFASRK